MGALVDFHALELIDASIERVLLFSYPALVVLIGSFMRRRAPERRVVLTMLLTYVGIFFAMGGVDLHELRQNLYGASLVLVTHSDAAARRADRVLRLSAHGMA